MILCGRAVGFGGLMAAFGIGNLIGPVVGDVLSPTAAASASLATRLTCVATVLLLLPESLSQQTMARVGCGYVLVCLPAKHVHGNH